MCKGIRRRNYRMLLTSLARSAMQLLIDLSHFFMMEKIFCQKRKISKINVNE